MWFDTHCHLYDLTEPPPAEAVARATEDAVDGIVVVGVDVATSKSAIELADSATIFAGAAFHPSETRGWQDRWADEIDELLQDARTVAVGETGIDLYWDKTFFEDQKRALLKHIELSRRHDKALVLHTRDSVWETIEILKGAGPPERVIFHCWSADLEALDAALGLGAYISFAGNSTYKSAEPLREAARKVPADRILIETDSPYLAPVPMRGKPNQPAFVAHTGRILANERGDDEQAFAETTTANARAIFGLA
jgi:TatD DNase family protein